jgi:amino acid adenylation domain-containing protein
VQFTREEVEQSVPARFETIVRHYPYQLALKFDDLALTYSELNGAANRLARAILADRGPGEEAVGLLIEPSVWLIVAILATLKTGKMYQVLDPAEPRSRLAAVLADSEAGLVLASRLNQDLASDLATPRVRVVEVETFARDFNDEADGANLDLSITPDALFSLMYTSGTTGEPKGVLHTHRNTLNAVQQGARRLGYTSDDRMVLLASGAFGASISNLFGSLLIGGCVLPYDIKRRGFLPLADWLDSERITVYQSVPTIFRELFGSLEPGRRLDTLRLVRLGSDTAFRSDLELFKTHCKPDCLFETSLAASETHVIANFSLRAADELTFEGSVVPSGYPIEGCELLLVDESGHPVAAGATGEILVKSRHISPGYWHRPEQTAAAFTQADDGARVYRTRDLGRLLPDGALLHLGRKDASIKVRGHLVPPAEVENAIRELVGVRDATVAILADGPGEHRLVAYVVAAAEPPANISGWRAHLAARLPDYMVPATFVQLPVLPRLPNGKVDRRALPLPGNERPTLANPYVAPRTPLEERVAEIWSDVLAVDRVGVDDDFLELGGNSLSAAQVISRVAITCQVELPLSAVFDVYTVAGLAELVAQQLVKSTGVNEVTCLLAELEQLSEADATAQLAADKV